MQSTKFAVRHATTVGILILMLVIFGLTSYKDLPREASPDIVIPYVLVTTAYFGVAPADIESLITHKLEKELKNIKNIDEITSTSAESMSLIAIKFLPTMDIDNALQLVREKVNIVKPDLPSDVEEPAISEIAFSDFPIIIINMTAPYDIVQLRDVAEKVQEELETIPGVLKVNLVGGLEREVQVDVDPSRLAFYSLSLYDVQSSIARENVNIPGGDIQIGRDKFLLRVPGEYDNYQEIADIVIKKEGGEVVRIKDVATVRFGFKEPDTYSRRNRVQSVSLSVSKRSGENLIEIADNIKATMEQMKPLLPKGTTFAYVNDNSKYIKEQVLNLENNIITGLILVIMSLFLFMGFRNSVFVAIAIPLSLLITFIVLRLIGLTLNMIVLFSLILALGMLVDNAIVIVENIYRHAHMGTATLTQATLRAVDEVAWPIISSTATTVSVFVPLLFWPGITGQFMGFLPKTIIITLIASLFVALVINPVICSRFLKYDPAKIMSDESVPDWRVLRFYRRMLSWTLNHRWITVAIGLVVFAGSLMIMLKTFQGIVFFPKTTPEAARISVTGPEGMTLDTTDQIVRRIEAVLKGEKNVEDLIADTGTAGGWSSNASNTGVVTVDFLDYEDLEEDPNKTIERIREQTRDIAGARIVVAVQEMGPPTRAPLAIQVSGKDFEKLGGLSRQIQEVIKQIKGVVDLRDDYEQRRPEMRVLVDREAAMRVGTNTQAIAGAIRTAFHGSEASKYRIDEDEYDITVRLKEEFRNSIDNLMDLTVPGKDGVPVPLRAVSNIEFASGFGSIRHVDTRRVVTISANVQGILASEALAKAQAKLAGFELPIGYKMEFAGEEKDQKESQEFLSGAFFVGIFLIFMILVTQFNSAATPLIILSSVVLSLVGVFWSLIITRQPVSIVMTGLGVISLAGVVVNNAIVLLDYINQLRARGMEDTAAIIHGGMVRFRPVIMTALTTVLGLLPMAVGVSFDFINFKWQMGGATQQWWAQMAWAVIFGLTFATLLTLVIVPTMYAMSLRWSERWAAIFGRWGFHRGDES